MSATPHVVVASSSNHTISAYGTSTGQPFGSEDAAEREARRYRRERPHLDFLVLPINKAVPRPLSSG